MNDELLKEISKFRKEIRETKEFLKKLSVIKQNCTLYEFLSLL